MLACQSVLLILHHLTFTNKSSPRTPAARAVLWPSVSYTTHTHTHASVGQQNGKWRTTEGKLSM